MGFNLILKAAGKDTSADMFWRLLIGTVMMLLFGYLGEIKAMPPQTGFALGMCGWFFILNEIFNGEQVAPCKIAVRPSRPLTTTCASSSRLAGPFILRATCLATSSDRWMKPT